MEYWHKDIRHLADPECAVLLLGNKIDIDQKVHLAANREVTKAEAAEFAKENGILFCEVSAMDNLYVNEAIISMARQIFRRYTKTLSSFKGQVMRPQDGIQLGKTRFECGRWFTMQPEGGQSDTGGSIGRRGSKCC